jgi:hypothetical protein
MKCYLETHSLLEKEADRWLAQKSLLHLRSFFSGFCTAEILGKDIKRLTPLINGFASTMHQKFGGGWEVFFQKGYDDADSFALYFSEWRLFIPQWQECSVLEEIAKSGTRSIDISSILEHIRLRPGMYFSTPSVGLLFSYLSGVERAKGCYAAQAQLLPDMRTFEAWLSRGQKLCRWDRFLLAENHFNESAAFTDFFKRIDEFKKESSRF